MLRASRRMALAGLACAAALGVTACGPVHAGAAATVGDTRITSNQVQTGAATMLNDAGTKASAAADPTGLQRQVLTNLIRDQLVAKGAQLKGVTVTEAAVQNQLADLSKQSGSRRQLEQTAAQHGIAAADLHDFIYYQLLQQSLEAKLTVGQTLETVHLKGIVVTQKPLADEALNRALADPTSFADLAQQYSQDPTSKANGGDLGDFATSSLPDPVKTDVETKALNVPFEETDGSTYYVFLITSRGKQPLLKTSAGQQLAQQALTSYLLSLNKQYPVKVSPRYGSWDQQSQAVTVAGTGSSPLSVPDAGGHSGSNGAALPSSSASPSAAPSAG